MGYNTIILIVFGVAILIFGIAYLVSKSKLNTSSGKESSDKNNNNSNVGHNILKNKPETEPESKEGYKKNTKAAVEKLDIFNFMEFDKIQDNMVIQQKGEKYTAIIRCKGINYNLMSEVEQLSVEEGFMNFLNTLKFPVQLYVQAQTVNLKGNIEEYKNNMKLLYNEYEEINSNYTAVLNSLEATDEEVEEIENQRSSILNVLEYGQDIVKYVERLTLNKSMLQRNFYVLVSYYKSELSNASSFNKEELLDICYSELFTRVQNIISALAMSSVSAKALTSNEIAELLYSAYNRDDKNYINLQQALDSGFYRLYSTSEDAIVKKQKKLVENMKQEAEYKALVALNKALEDGTYITETEAEDAYDQQTSRQAIDKIQKERVPEEVKQKAKKIIVEEYKKAKKERFEKQEEKLDEMQKQVDELKQKNAEAELSTDVIEKESFENITDNQSVEKQLMDNQVVDNQVVGNKEEDNSTADEESIV